MTTEDDFQEALDENPEDWQTRLVFADWLQDHNDPRAEGYRALGELQMYPIRVYSDVDEWTWFEPGRYTPPDRTVDPDELPSAWFAALPDRRMLKSGVPVSDPDAYFQRWADFPSRRAAEDAAALAYTAYRSNAGTGL